jgi:hypothetical protein
LDRTGSGGTLNSPARRRSTNKLAFKTLRQWLMGIASWTDRICWALLTIPLLSGLTAAPLGCLCSHRVDRAGAATFPRPERRRSTNDTCLPLLAQGRPSWSSPERRRSTNEPTFKTHSCATCLPLLAQGRLSWTWSRHAAKGHTGFLYIIWFRINDTISSISIFDWY